LSAQPEPISPILIGSGLQYQKSDSQMLKYSQIMQHAVISEIKDQVKALREDLKKC
jgi:hypothetical protein